MTRFTLLLIQPVPEMSCRIAGVRPSGGSAAILPSRVLSCSLALRMILSHAAWRLASSWASRHLMRRSSNGSPPLMAGLRAWVS